MRTLLLLSLLLISGCRSGIKSEADNRPLAAGVIAVHQKIPAK